MRGEKKDLGYLPASERKLSGETGKTENASEILLDAIGALPEEMVAEAQDLGKIRRHYQKNRRRRFCQVGGGFAAAALICAVVWGARTGTGILSREPAGDSAVQEGAKTAGFGHGNEEEVGSSGLAGDITSGRIMEPSEAEQQFGVSFPASGTKKAADTGESKGAQNHSKEKVDKKSVKSGDGKAGTIQESKDTSEENSDVWEERTIRLQTEAYRRMGENVQQFLMELGETEEKRTYTLTASGGISFLTAAPLDGEQGKTEQLKEIKEYSCTSGTKLGFSLEASGNPGLESGMAVPDGWKDGGIKGTGYIRIQVEEGTKTERSVTVLIGKRAGKYYAAFLE